jgi:MFS family permease
VHADPAAGTEPVSSPALSLRRYYPWYVAGVLMVAYVLSFLDRQILYLMVGPIRRDLHITDFEFSLLTGGALGIFYTLMGLPIGYLADRYNRKNLIAIGITVWSLMTVLCGLARSYPILFLGRIGVGVGEATLSPSAYSVLSDSFDKTRLPRAMSLYVLGLFIGAGLALIIGGEIVGLLQKMPDVALPFFGAIRSWNLVFIVIGLPGLLIALWVWTLREPARTGAVPSAMASGTFPFAEVIGFLRRYPLMALSLFVGSAMFSVIAYTDSWYPELFVRTWGWTARETGRMNGISSLIGGPLGLLFAGWYSSRALARGESDACLKLTAWAALGIMIPACLLPIAPDATLMAGLLIPYKFFIGFTPVLIPSAIQMVAPNHLRAQLGATFLLATGLFGVSMGPILPAFLSDFVFTGARALPHALSTTALVLGPFTFCITWLGLKQYRQRYAEMAQTRHSG